MFVMLAAAMSLLLCGCRMGQVSIDEYWRQDWYGWYLVSDATGIYEELKDTSQDCIVRTAVTNGWRENFCGEFYLYTQEHTETPWFSFHCPYENFFLSFDAESGLLEEEEMTVLDFTFFPKGEIGLDHSLLCTGTIGNEEGTITCDIFLTHWDEPKAWKKLKWYRGEMESDYEDLIPWHYEDVYLPYIEEHTQLDISEFFTELKTLEESQQEQGGTQ